MAVSPSTTLYGQIRGVLSIAGRPMDAMPELNKALSAPAGVINMAHLQMSLESLWSRKPDPLTHEQAERAAELDALQSPLPA